MSIGRFWTASFLENVARAAADPFKHTAISFICLVQLYSRRSAVRCTFRRCCHSSNADEVPSIGADGAGSHAKPGPGGACAGSPCSTFFPRKVMLRLHVPSVSCTLSWLPDLHDFRRTYVGCNTSPSHDGNHIHLKMNMAYVEPPMRTAQDMHQVARAIPSCGSMPLVDLNDQPDACTSARRGAHNAWLLVPRVLRLCSSI
jgi:hypothetical protein